MGGLVCNECRVVIRPVEAGDVGEYHLCDECERNEKEGL
jgi:hypothetical protein